MLFASGRIIGKGRYHAPKAFYRARHDLIPDYARTREMRPEIGRHSAILNERLGRYLPGTKFPHVVLAESDTLEEPLGQAFPGFDMVLVKDLLGRMFVGGAYAQWVMAHEFGHILQFKTSFDAFFGAHSELELQRGAFTTAVIGELISLEIDHAAFSNGLYRSFKYIPHDRLNVLTLEKIYRDWLSIREASPRAPYSFIEGHHDLSGNERNIFAAYVLFALLDLAHKRATFQAYPDLCESVCNYLACVVTDISIEEFLESPLSLASEKDPQSPAQARLFRLAQAFPQDKIRELMTYFAAGEMGKIISPP